MSTFLSLILPLLVCQTLLEKSTVFILNSRLTMNDNLNISILQLLCYNNYMYIKL